MDIQNTKWKRKFLIIVAGQTISLIGSSAVQFTMIWWLASETSSPLMMAFSGLVAFLPQMILGPFVGVWIDRLKRKYVIIAADMAMGVIALLFALYFQIGNPPYWTVCLVLGMRAVGNVFHTPAMHAVVPMLVPTDQLVKANGWSQFLQSGAFMLGPVLGAAMFAVLPMPIILMTDFFGALAACACILFIVIPDPPSLGAQSPHFLRELKEGASIFVSDKALLSATLTTTACMVFFLPLSSYYPLMSSDYFSVSALHGSLVELAYAGGMLAAALIMSFFGNIKRKFLVVHCGLLGIGLTSLLCGLLPPQMWAFWIFTLICCIMGASGNIYGIPFMAYMQETIPPEAQGRAFSLFGSLMSAAMPLGLLLSGPYTEQNGVKSWFFISGIAVIIFVAVDSVYLLFSAEHRKS